MTEKAPPQIRKTAADFLSKYKSTQPPSIGGVETALTALPVLKPGHVGDYFRLHPSEDDYWSHELCFVRVPIPGVKEDTLHLIREELAVQYLPAKKIQRHRLALASKPYDVFFLCVVPSQNLDNSWNASAVQACEQAKSLWVQACSRKAEGIESYKIDKARDHDAFPDPKWPSCKLEALIEVTFRAACIDNDDDPGLCRLIGARQNLR